MDSKGALKELKQYQSTSKSAGDYYKESQNELGVGGARAEQQQMRDLIRGTQQQLEGVGQSVAGRTRGNLVTEAQRARLQSLEERPLAERLGEQQTQYGDASTNYRDLLSQAGTQAGMAYQSQNDRESALQRQYDTLFGREQVDAEQSRYEKQFAETMRQFNADLALKQQAAAESRRQFERQMAQDKNKQAQEASLYSKLSADQERRQALADEAQRKYIAQTRLQAATKASDLANAQAAYDKESTRDLNWLNPLRWFGVGRPS